MLVKILNFLGLVEGICLQDMDGKEYLTFIRKGKFGPWSRVYPFVGVGHVLLLPDGTTKGSSIYIKRWVKL